MTNTAPVKLDGGSNNPLPAEVRGFWDEDVFHIEEVVITIGGKEYDLIENLSPATLDNLHEQARDYFEEMGVRR